MSKDIACPFLFVVIVCSLSGCTYSGKVQVRNDCDFPVTATWNDYVPDDVVTHTSFLEDGARVIAPGGSETLKIENAGWDNYILVRRDEDQWSRWEVGIPFNDEEGKPRKEVVIEGKYCQMLD